MDRKVSIIFDTLNDLITDPDVVGGMIVKTLGDEEIGDGKGHIYKVYDPSMGKIYDPTKHVQLAKSNVFAEVVKDNELYDKADKMQKDIDELKASGQAVDLTKFTVTHQTLEDVKSDGSLRAGRTVNTLGLTSVGDGGGATYKIYAHDPTTPYEGWEIPITTGELVAVKIVDSETNKIAHENKDDIVDIKETLNSGYLRVYDTLTELTSDENVAAGMIVKTLGETASGDGNGRTYKIYDEHSGVPFDPEKDIELAVEGTFADPINDVVFYDEINQINDIVRMHTNQLSGINHSINTINNSINELNNKTTSHDSQITSMGFRVTTLEDTIGTISVKHTLDLTTDHDVKFVQYSNLVTSIFTGTYVAPEPEPDPDPTPDPDNTDNTDGNEDNTDPITNAPILGDGDNPDESTDTDEPTNPDEPVNPDEPGDDPEPVDPGYEVTETDGVVEIKVNDSIINWIAPKELSNLEENEELYFGDNVKVKRVSETVIIPPEEEGGEPTEETVYYTVFTITKIATRRVYQYV